MKKLFLPVVVAGFISACGGGASVSEAELVASFEKNAQSFSTVFNTAANYDAAKLTALSDSAILLLDELQKQYPKSAQVPELMYKAGELCMQSNKGKQAVAYFTQLADSFPEHEAVPKAMYFIGYTLETVLEDVEGAKTAYKKLYRGYPQSDWAENARSQVLYLNNPTSGIESMISEPDSLDQDSL